MANIETETYFELLSAGICNTPSQLDGSADIGTEAGELFDVTFLSTFRPINTADFDGTCTWTFEIVARNQSALQSGFAYVVDEDENVCATIEVPHDTTGPWNYIYSGGDLGRDNEGGYKANDQFRFTATFTPTVGDHQYGLRQYLEHIGCPEGVSSEAIFEIVEATIILHQVNPTKSAVHIPMMTEINGCSMNWNHVPVGYKAITNGSESMGNVEIDWDTYEGGEIVDSTYESQVRQIWKYEADKLTPVSKVVFDAGIGYPSGTITPSYEYLFGTPDFSWCRAGLRWCPVNTGASPANLTGTFTTEVCTDALSNVFTYIEGSDCTWFQDTDGHTWHVRVLLDIASLTAADGSYLYVAANENVYSGEGGNGAYHHWGMFRDFSLPVGRTIVSAWIDYSVGGTYPMPDADNFKVEFGYVLDDEINPGYIVLYDKTADEYVLGSELVWNENVAWERKSVTLASTVLTDGHEYMARWKRDLIVEDWHANPMPSDVNLTVYVENIEEFTSYQRVTKQWVTNTVFEYVYEDWGAKPEGSSVAEGVVNIFSRSKLFKPENSEVFYEVTAVEFFDYSDGSDYAPSWYRSSLWDCGTDDNAIGTTKSEEIEESAITWTIPGDGHLIRRRTADIAQYLTDQNRYVDYQPVAPEEWFYYPVSGFILVHYLVSEVPIVITGAGERSIEYFANHELFHDISNAMFLHCALVWNGGTLFDITDIQKGSLIVTAPGHDFEADDKVRIYDVLGMVEANSDSDGEEYYTVASVDGDDFTIADIDASLFGEYISGGKVGIVGNSLSGLPTAIYTDGRTVRAVGDGRYEYNGADVASGALTLPFYANQIIVGLPYRMILEPNNPSAGSAQGSVRGKKQKINAATLAFYETVGCEIGMDEDNLHEIPSLSPGTQSGVVHFETGVLFSEDMTLEFDGDWKEQATICIVSDNGMPFLLKAVIPVLNVNEPPS
jgi:hypothetical protein